VHGVTWIRVGDRWIRARGTLIALPPAAELAVRAVCKMCPRKDRHEMRQYTTKYDDIGVFRYKTWCSEGEKVQIFTLEGRGGGDAAL